MYKVSSQSRQAREHSLSSSFPPYRYSEFFPSHSKETRNSVGYVLFCCTQVSLQSRQARKASLLYLNRSPVIPCHYRILSRQPANDKPERPISDDQTAGKQQSCFAASRCYIQARAASPQFKIAIDLCSQNSFKKVVKIKDAHFTCPISWLLLTSDSRPR